MKKLLLALLLLPVVASATSLRWQPLVHDGSGAAANFTADDTTNAYCFDERITDVVLYLEATENSGTGTLDVKLQHGNTSAGPWIDYTDAAFTQATATGNQVIRLNNQYSLLSCVNIVVDLGASGSPDYDVLVEMYYNRETE